MIVLWQDNSWYFLGISGDVPSWVGMVTVERFRAHSSLISAQTMAQTSESKWAFLHQWCAPVRARLNLGKVWRLQSRKPEAKTLEINLKLPENGFCPDHLLDIRDALVLLTLLARVDMKAWVYVMTTFCNIPAAKLENTLACLENASFDKLRFEVWVDDNELADITSIEQLDFPKAVSIEWLLIGLEAKVYRTKKLEMAIQNILSHTPPNVAVDPLVDVCVSLRCKVPSGLWEKMRQLWANNGGWRFPIPVECEVACSIVLEPNPRLAAMDTIDETARELVGIVTECGDFTIEQLKSYTEPTWFQEQQRLDEASLIQTLGRINEQVFCAGGSSPESRANLKAVDINGPSQTPTRFVLVCSAIANCRRTSKCTVTLLKRVFEDEEEASRDRKWVWQSLAYALFSSYARVHSTISSVAIKVFMMNQEDIEAIAELLSSSDPTSLLYDRHNNFNNVRDQSLKMLRKGVMLKVEPLGDSFETISEDTAVWELTTDVDHVQVLHDDPEQSEIFVVVPGYGVCSVAREALQPTTSAPLADNPVTSLELYWTGFDPIDYGSISQFLQLVGSPLTRLVVFSGLDIDECPFAAILSSCPNLKSLNVGLGSICTESFLQAYHSSKVCLEDLDCRFDDAILLMNELKDTTNRLGQTLKGLKCYARDWQSAELALASIREMLALNKVLEFFHLEADGMNTTVTGGFAIPESFTAEFHNEPLPAAQSPLPVKCRIAFICVFYSYGRSRIGNPLNKRLCTLSTLGSLELPRDVMERVFAFAAPRVLRRVYVSPHEY